MRLSCLSHKNFRNFTLQIKNGKSFTSQSFENFWNFVIVGNLQDTSCDNLLRTYCNGMEQSCAQAGAAKKPEPLKQAIKFYNPAFTAASGEQKEMHALGQQIGLYHETTSCNLDSSMVALVSPEGYLRLCSPA